MKKQLMFMMLILALCAGCGNSDNSRTSENTNIVETQPEEDTTQMDEPASDTTYEDTSDITPPESSQENIPESTQTDTDEAGFSFADLDGQTFYFASGAGAWNTELFINSDGTFQGNYHDSDMGDTGEGYPGGTLYYCDFTGSFRGLAKINEFTYKTELDSLNFNEEHGKKEIKDDILYVYSTAYGLDNGKEFYLYLPGAKLSDLPDAYLNWVGYTHELENNPDATLPFYGLFNINTEDGFSSYEDEFADESLQERISREISYAEDIAADLEAKLQQETTQADLNETSKELFQIWDDTLNLIWNLLTPKLDDNTMEILRQEERDWIASKEAAAKAAGQEFEGGSMQQMAEWSKAAELTKERVYELAEYAD